MVQMDSPKISLSFVYQLAYINTTSLVEVVHKSCPHWLNLDFFSTECIGFSISGCSRFPIQYRSGWLLQIACFVWPTVQNPKMFTIGIRENMRYWNRQMHYCWEMTWIGSWSGLLFIFQPVELLIDPPIDVGFAGTFVDMQKQVCRSKPFQSSVSRFENER